MDGAIQPGLDRQGDEVGILAVGLTDEALAKRLHAPGFDTDGRQAAFKQAAIEIRREQTGLESGQLERWGVGLEKNLRLRWLAMDLALEYYPAPLIEHTDSGQSQRNIQPGVVFHGLFYPPVVFPTVKRTAIFTE